MTKLWWMIAPWWCRLIIVGQALAQVLLFFVCFIFSWFFITASFWKVFFWFLPIKDCFLIFIYQQLINLAKKRIFSCCLFPCYCLQEIDRQLRSLSYQNHCFLKMAQMKFYVWRDVQPTTRGAWDFFRTKEFLHNVHLQM